MANPTETNGVHEVYLYDPAILAALDLSTCRGTYKGGISPQNPGDGLVLRPLALADYHNGYLQLLKQLTKVGEVSQEQYEDRFNKMKACADTYYIVVIEDKSTGQVIGSASLIKEQKFIHSATARARVEDVIVSDQYRGKQLGKILLDVLFILSKAVGCYKVSLECKDNMVQFYTLFGFTNPAGQNYMDHRWFD
ncbi:glucosamine 6-phosphate N-acetyltransferase-like [Littorina saxatilis]|uniref:Glucosamine 6-phosphate N-acetyltransferase n=1 Tax=Littorina saxatilis TaxID=31220 RepID=A0AAN9GDL7_9CAEN